MKWARTFRHGRYLSGVQHLVQAASEQRDNSDRRYATRARCGKPALWHDLRDVPAKHVPLCRRCSTFQMKDMAAR